MRARDIYKYVTTTPGNTNYTILKQMLDSYVTRANNSLYNYTVTNPTVDLLGKTAADLQENFGYNDGLITGKLKKVTGYTAFSGEPVEQSGYYLALTIANEDADSIKVSGSTVDPVDDTIVIIMEDANGNRNNSGKLKVELIKNNVITVDYIDVSQLIYED